MGQELRNFLDSDIIRGKVAVQRAYADWRRYPQYIVPLSEASIDLIFAPAYGSSKKNATDIRLAIDALELVFTRPEIGTFILLSGDSDFSSLVLKLKEYGKYVIGVGLQESTSDILVQNCDEYFSYNCLSGLTSADEIRTEKHDPWELTSKAIARMAQRGDIMRSDRLKQVMLEMDPSFDEKSAGFTKFNRFLGEAAQRELLRLQKRENGQYEVSLPKGGAPASDATSSGAEGAAPVRDESSSGGGRSRRGRRGGRSGRGRRGRSDAAVETTSESSPPPPAAPRSESATPDDALKAAYAALTEVVDQLYTGDAPVRDSMAKRKLLARDSSFNEGNLGFSKFSLFLRKAHEDGVVDMKQHDDRNYYLTPVAGGDRSAPGRSASAAGESTEAATRQAPDRAADHDGGSDTEQKDTSPFSAAAAAARRTFGRFRRGSGPGAAPAQPESRPPMGPVDEPPLRESSDSATPRPSQRSGADAIAGSHSEDAPPAKKPASQRPAATRSEAKPSSGRSSAKRDQAKPPGERSSAKRQEAKSPSGRSSARRDEAKSPSGRSSAKRDEARPPGKPPVAEPPIEPPIEPSRAKTADKPPVAEPDSKTAAEPAAASPPRGMGRYRSGSRGRKSAAPSAGSGTRSRIGLVPDDELPSGAAPKARPERRDPEPEGPTSEPTGPGAAPEPTQGGPVDHMVRNYAGVGKRTAEALFEHFGDGVFDIIDREPGRLTEVLSEGRAKSVVKARRVEREGGTLIPGGDAGH